MLAIVGVIIYAIYVTCLGGNRTTGDYGDDSSRSRQHGYGSRPPPPGFRPEYTSGGKKSKCAYVNVLPCSECVSV